jgi:acyl carrier protein
MDVQKRILEFIRSEILLGDEHTSLGEDTPLLDGAMDSLGLMQLVAFLEEEFDMELADDQITSENFRTVNDVTRLISSSVAAR